jgi:hypothetical protein
MRTRIIGAALVLASCHALGCRGPSLDEAPPAPAPAVLPMIVLDEAPGIIRGTPVVARGIAIGTVESLELERQHVIMNVRLDAGHEPTLGEGACVRVSREADAVVLELELGRGEAAPQQLERCARAVDLADTGPQVPAVPPTPRPPEVDEPESEPQSEPAPKPKPKLAKPSCDEGLSFSTLSVTEVDAVPLHLPTGGWRAKIRFANDGDGFVEIEGVSSAAFIDKAGAGLDVASLPGSGDWFMPFEVPPHSSKDVTVTFHHDGGPKPWVDRVKYSWFCS